MEVRAPIVDRDGSTVGAILLAGLPRRLGSAEPLVHDGVAAVREGLVYRFSVELDGDGPVVLEPGDELFSFDTQLRRTGRLEPRQHVGRIRIAVEAPEAAVAGVAEIEVLPTKLEHATEYQHMLGDVAAIATEALLQGFAPASLSLRQGDRARLETPLLYQQFAFLHARLTSQQVRDALALVAAQPYRAWRTEAEAVAAGRMIPNSSRLGRVLAGPGPRVATNGRLRLATVPTRLERDRTEATVDSPPNRFVKYALQRWRSIAQLLVDRLQASDTPDRGPVRRGLRAARELVDEIDRALAAPIFAEVGRLDVFPYANQVLHKQEGYRQLFSTFALGEVGASLGLDWDLDDVFSASQRNVATLYEYWAFVQLVEAVGDACGTSRAVEALTATSDGLSLSFREGGKSGVRWEVVVNERVIEVEVFFNRSFLASRVNRANSSWSRAMRPDCSLRIRPKSSLLNTRDGALDVWLHFDAKYRVERVREQFDAGDVDSEAAAVDAEVAERIGRSKREDLLKMHAYRDAIRHSAGAYVLFPGDEQVSPFREFEEPLPGLGAFVLRPVEDGPAVGRQALRDFVAEAVEHVADRATQHERDRYWRAVVRSEPAPFPDPTRSLPSLEAPPLDTPVLCAMVSPEAYEETAATGAFFLPGDLSEIDGPALVAEWLILGVVGDPPTLWRRASKWSLLPSAVSASEAPAGRLGTRVNPALEAPAWFDQFDVARVTRTGTYNVVTWGALIDDHAVIPRLEMD